MLPNSKILNLPKTSKITKVAKFHPVRSHRVQSQSLTHVENKSYNKIFSITYFYLILLLPKFCIN